jgi:hypothetical protein
VRQLLTTSSFHLTYILLDGLSIPFFNLGQNVSRTVTRTSTLTSLLSRFQPDWVLSINDTVATSSEVPNVAVHEVQVASLAASTNRDTPTIVSSHDIESGPVVDERIDEMESKTMVKGVHFF